MIKDIVFLILAILGLVWTVFSNEFEYYAGGSVENSMYIIRGGLSGMALLMIIVCVFTIGYSFSKIINEIETPYKKE